MSCLKVGRVVEPAALGGFEHCEQDSACLDEAPRGSLARTQVRRDGGHHFVEQFRCVLLHGSQGGATGPR